MHNVKGVSQAAIPQLTHSTFLKAWLWWLNPGSLLGKVVSQHEAPFSLTCSIAICCWPTLSCTKFSTKDLVLEAAPRCPQPWVVILIPVCWKHSSTALALFGLTTSHVSVGFGWFLWAYCLQSVPLTTQIQCPVT